MTTTTTTAAAPDSYPLSVAATHDSRMRSDLWAIADALLAEVPVGTRGRDQRFAEVRDRCAEAGVEPYSISAMRQYRDVAAAWPEAERIPGVSFSAHRAAKSADDPRALLERLAKQHGAKSVSARMVEAEVALSSHGVAALTQQQQQSQPLTLSAVDNATLARELVANHRAASEVARDLIAVMGNTNATHVASALSDIATEVAKSVAAQQQSQSVFGQRQQTAPAAAAPAAAAPAAASKRAGSLRSL